jgi:hypothetical protein
MHATYIEARRQQHHCRHGAFTFGSDFRSSSSTHRTTGKSTFAVCFDLWRAFYIGCTAKSTFCRAFLPAHDNECFLRLLFLGARQTNFFPSATAEVNVVSLCRASCEGARQRHSLCHAFSSVARQTYIFAMHFPKAHDKIFFFNFDVCTSFYFSTSKTLFCILYSNLIHVSINLLFLIIMCHLKNFCHIRQILTASA